MKVTIRRCDFCGEFIPEDEEMLLVGKIDNGNWSHHADMCKQCFQVLTSRSVLNANKEKKGEE